MDQRHGLRWVAGENTPPAVYITRVFNFGTWEEWKHLHTEYTSQDIERAVREPIRGQWTRRGKALAEIVYNCRLPEDVLLSYDA